MVLARCKRCGAPLFKVPAFCKCGAYVLAEDRPLVAAVAAGESSATVTEAFTYIPPPTLSKDQIQTEAVPGIEPLPYTYGIVVAVTYILMGVCLVFFGLFLLADTVLGGLTVVALGGLPTWLGYALLRRAQLAIKIVRVSAVLGIGTNVLGLFVAMLISGEVGNALSCAFGLVISFFQYNYFNNRVD